VLNNYFREPHGSNNAEGLIIPDYSLGFRDRLSRRTSLRQLVSLPHFPGEPCALTCSMSFLKGLGHDIEFKFIDKKE
jgi:hypothetical protein